MRKQTLSRRHFLAASGAVAVPFIVPSSVFGKNAPSNQITIGCIGMGGQGVTANMNSFLNQNDAKIVAVCDAYLSRAQNAAGMVDNRYKTKGCKVYQDCRKIIADPAIDAVCISTPDHWHVPMSLMALEAGPSALMANFSQGNGKPLNTIYAANGICRNSKSCKFNPPAQGVVSLN